LTFAQKIGYPLKNNGSPATGGLQVWEIRKKEDCRLKEALLKTALALACLAALLPACSNKAPRHNVLFITIDTLRADHLGCYDYPRNTSPSIDAFAKQSVVFEKCIAQSTSTMPSHASIFTSLHPPTHGVVTNVSRLSENVPSLITVFENNDYMTGAIISSFVLESDQGLTQGFKTYDETLESSELNRAEYRERPADSATDAAITWLREHGAEPFFLWVHYIDPHGAYYPPNEYRDMFVEDEWYGESTEVQVSEGHVPGTIPKYQELPGTGNPAYYIAQYDAEIRFTDDHIGRLFAFLEESGLGAETIVVLTADHGESLIERDHYFAHSFRTYDEQAIIPLIMRFPDTTVRGRIEAQVRAIDIMPTLLDRLGLKNPHRVQGQSLMKLVTSDKKPPSDHAIIYSEYGLKFLELSIGAQKSIRTSKWKLTQNLRDGAWELYNLEDDPLETTDLADKEKAVLDELRTMLEDREAKMPKSDVEMSRLTPEQIEQFNAFGYLTK
jgi:arylsulfatase